MHIAYYDESGDDGYPEFSSPLFVLTTCYLHYGNWQEAVDRCTGFRRYLKDTYGLPVKFEIHTRPLLLNKRPYRALGLATEQRISIVSDACRLIAHLPLRIINVAIIKRNISGNDYGVLDRAFTYSIQRIENDLDPTRNPERRFLIITDPGRLGIMRKTARRVRKFNYIPSRFGSAYRQEIRTLIEDPLPKDSKESHFIQICDLVSYIVYLYGLQTRLNQTLSNRMPSEVDTDQIRSWLEILLPSLNTLAAADDPYGVRFSPK
ncbi:MAG TPA: DUF3800 domain-containing protein [Candidatus Krumholzibacteria bacterium]|nr:DUF3800 domain-containing protein [Candidatus Krumholzibacteria bacterium]HRX50966.1 DUF3800 domain-containing protein [Candidatus Krumholzibacteria bacterium]